MIILVAEICFLKLSYFLLLLLFTIFVGGGGYLCALIVFEKETARKEQLLKKECLKVKGLLSQMDPHFTYNALNSIQSYILGGKTEAALDCMNDFSLIMRKSYDNFNREFISLAQEVDCLKHYVRLEEMRFPDKFIFQLSFDPMINPNDIYVPSMLIQSFLEKFIDQGTRVNSEVGLLRLSFYLEPDKYLCCQIDSDSDSNSVGDNCTKEIKYGRIVKITGKETIFLLDWIKMLNNNVVDGRMYDFTITDLISSQYKPGGTRIAIRIPLQS